MTRKLIGGSIVAVAGAVLTAGCLVAIASTDPIDALRAFFGAPFSSVWFFGKTLDAAALLTTAGLGVAIAFQAGTFNLGGEGQLYAGGLAASVMLLGFEGADGSLMLAAAALTGSLVGASMAGLCGELKSRFGINELITTFLLSAAFTPVADFLLSGPLRDETNNLLATPRFSADRMIPRLLEPSALNWSAPLSIGLALLTALLLEKTATGFRVRVAGSNPRFSAYAGIESRRYWAPALAISGALHGLAGFFAVAGTYGLCHRGFSGGLGWSALAVALIARNNPTALIPAAIIFAWLQIGAEAAELRSGLSFETAAFAQAVLFLLVTAKVGLRLFSRRGRV